MHNGRGALLARAERGPDLALALCEWDVVRVGVQKGLESHISLKPRQPPTPGSCPCFLTTEMQIGPRSLAAALKSESSTS